MMSDSNDNNNNLNNSNIHTDNDNLNADTGNLNTDNLNNDNLNTDNLNNDNLNTDNGNHGNGNHDDENLKADCKGKGNGKSNQRPDTETLILQAAEDEFLSKGFDGARTAAIAERAGVTHAMLHYYFRTKEKLYDKVLETKTSEMRGVMFGFIDNESAPLTERIEKCMRRHFEYLLNNPKLPLFVINELNRKDSKVLKHLNINREAVNRIQVSMQDATDAAAKAGECRKVSAQSLLLDIISLNVFSFIGAPLLDCIFPDTAGNRETFLRARLEENIKTVLNKLRP